MIAPLAARRAEISGLSGSVVDVPGFGEVMSKLNLVGLVGDEPELVDGGGGGFEGGSSGPVVRG
jgi:hypothetical protein